MRKSPTYFLTPVPIAGTLAEQFKFAVETRTETEYDVVVRALESRYGVSKITTLWDLTGLSPDYAIFADTHQYVIFLNSEAVRDYAQTVLFNLAKKR